MEAASSLSDYEEAIAFLYGRINYEHRPVTCYRPLVLNLRRMRRLLARLGDPHRQLKIVHVAGTKGKGSTATMISRILSSAGYRTGLYTSPHLERLEERMVIGERRISPDELLQLVREIRPAVEEFDRRPGGDFHEGTRPTFFEVTTALAMLYFARQAVEAAVLEVGLGGRLDSTNVCHPLVSVITSISFDHTRQLGNTLSAIAYEKAGIIKRGVPVVSGVTQAEPAETIARVSRQRRCRLFRLGHEFECEYRLPDAAAALQGNGGSLSYREAHTDHRCAWDGLTLGLLGRHQANNAAVALAAVNRLRSAGWAISEESIRTGLARARCPARIEIVGHSPTLILDAAHNVASIEALVQTLRESFPAGPRILIFATTRDKDREGMLRKLLPEFDTVIFTRYLSNPRFVPPEELAALARNMPGLGGGLTSHCPSVCPSPQAAWELCRSQMTPDHLVCITGSFFLAAEMRPLVAAHAT